MGARSTQTGLGLDFFYSRQPRQIEYKVVQYQAQHQCVWAGSSRRASVLEGCSRLDYNIPTYWGIYERKWSNRDLRMLYLFYIFLRPHCRKNKNPEKKLRGFITFLHMASL